MRRTREMGEMNVIRENKRCPCYQETSINRVCVAILNPAGMWEAFAGGHSTSLQRQVKSLSEEKYSLS